MIAALIIAIITGGLVGIYMETVTSELNYAHRARMTFQATNLAEAGLETAIHSLNHENWSDWTAGADGYYRDTFDQSSEEWLYVSYSFRGEKRHFRTYIEPNPATKGKFEPPKAIAEGIITLSDGTQVRRQVYIELGNRSLWANGLLAKKEITFNGNGIMVDSYESSQGWYNEIVNRKDNGTVVSLSVFPDIINSGNADIFGQVATGGDSENPNPPDVGPNGSVRSINDPEGTVDPNRIAYDFKADLPDPTYPDLSGAIPDVPVDKAFGTLGTHTTYAITGDFKVASQDVDSDLTDDGMVEPEYNVHEDAYTIEGDVTIFVDGSININGMLKILPNSSVKIYLTGDLIVDGNQSSIINPTGDPTNLIVFGLGKDDPLTPKDETPQMKLAGNGSFAGAVYAPNYDIVLGGSGTAGEMYGAVVALTIELGGGYQFHYDEDLAGYESPLAKKVTRWIELTNLDERRNMDNILVDGL